MNCPRCGYALEKSFHEGKVTYACPRGHGRALTLSAVRALCGKPDLANLLWRKASDAPDGIGGICPVCGRPMALIRLPVEGTELELDVCCRCQELWFDPNELKTLPKPPPPPPMQEMPRKAREILAMHTIESMEPAKPDPAPSSAWGYLAAILGFPLEKGAPALMSYPWCTWSLAAICIVVFLLTVGNLQHYVQMFGMIPGECMRDYGLTFITSMFLHGGFAHLLGNVYFLLIFGDNVEDVLGKPVFLLVALLSGLAGSLLHILFAPEAMLPCVGASGFISGIIAAYAVFFPKVTLSFCCRWGFMFHWFGLPAWGAFTLWMLYQGAMAFLAYPLKGGVAFGAHLGGAIVGLIAGFLLRRQAKQRLSALQ